MDNCEDLSPLPMRLAVEWTSAILSSFTVAPVISIVDKAIVANASGKEKLVSCLINGFKTLFTKPVHFLKQPAFLMIWGVYGSTYVVANSIESIAERSKRSAVVPKFIGSSVTNMSLSVIKDKAYARMFGVGNPRPFPSVSLGLFATRDCMTILASFTLPTMVGQALDRQFHIGKQTADNLAQLTVPCLMQFVSSPLHLYGLDKYNRPDRSLTYSDRFSRVKQEYLKTSFARVARIMPAFGVSGVINKYVRKTGKDWLNGCYHPVKSL
ncbi:putative membrane protein [Pseudolycoriella hygida]|uniref:Membrane protein n=1 Tax=Pseudolycoriella hygida TaxID=35572 RepID=A0A9Q0N7R5_9DIPT|nr:putative membrane protein [Pseudolycoriella hygida]